MSQSQENCLYVDHRYYLRKIGRGFAQEAICCVHFLPTCFHVGSVVYQGLFVHLLTIWLGDFYLNEFRILMRLYQVIKNWGK